MTGTRLRAWLTRCGSEIEPAMEADNFDLLTNLVSLGLGMSIVPHRVLALYPNRRKIQRIITSPKFSRDLVVIVRKQPSISPTLRTFLENILFSL